MRLYCEVPEARVNPLTVAMAHATLTAVKHELGLHAEIELHWFCDYGSDLAQGVQLKDTFTHMEMGGFTGGSEEWQRGWKAIWVRAEKTPRAAIETVAHEVCHVHQYHRFGDFAKREDLAYQEQWARDFAAQWARKTSTDEDLRAETQRLNRLTAGVLRQAPGSQGPAQPASQQELERKWLQERPAGRGAQGEAKVYFPHPGARSY